MNKKILRNVVVLLVIAVVVVLGFLFNKARYFSPPRETSVTRMPASQQDKEQESNVLPQEKGVKDLEISSKTTGPPEKGKSTVLATVNGEAIISEMLSRELENLPAQYREAFKNDKEEFLNQLIIKEILLQEAKRQELEKNEQVKKKIEESGGQKEQILIQELMSTITQDVTVSTQEIGELYEELKNEIPDRSLKEVWDQLRTYLLQQKSQKVLEEKIEELKSEAKITKNEEWLKAQRMTQASNPLDEALKKDMPVIADFGRGQCIPCKEMKPILEELTKEYKGKASIVVIEIDEYRSLTRRYNIKLIPTQIFFDAQGNEIYRHEGFMGKEAIEEKLGEMGVK